VGRHVRPPTSPTTRASAAPEKAYPQCITVVATVGIKWPGPSSSKDDLSGSSTRLEKPDPQRVRLPTSGLEAHSARVGATGALDSRKLLIIDSWAGPTASPRVLQMQKVGGTQLPPRSGPIDQGFEA
jgi:hypothetical protein